MSLLNKLKSNLIDNFFFNNIIVSSILLTVYAFLFSFLLPYGVNNIFVTRISKFSFLLFVLLLIFFAVYYYSFKKKEYKFLKPAEKFEFVDIFLLLLPLTPIIRYILLNMDILSFLEAIIIFGLFFIIACVLVIVTPVLLSRFASKRVLMMVGLSLTYLIFNMASLSADFGWLFNGELRVQFPYLLSVFFITLIIYELNKKILVTAIVLFFATTILINYTPKDFMGFTNTPKIYTLIEGKEMDTKPDIFLLVYESYVENETMLYYGIDNSEQEEYLIRNGFYLYKGTYSIAAETLTSMERVLNLSIPTSNAGVAGDGSVQNILRKNTYETLGIFTSDYMFRKHQPSYDYYFPKVENYVAANAKLLAKQIFEGSFRFDAGFEKIEYEDYLKEKGNVLESKSNKPRFLYTHNSYPGHSQNSGRALGNEVDIYREGLAKANEEMRKDVEKIIVDNPNAILIVAGDHGPYLTKNCSGTQNEYTKSEINRYDIQDRFGSFLAIRWPEPSKINHEKIEILQDIFPAVFAYLYNNAIMYEARIDSLTLQDFIVSGVRVRNGIIEGGMDDGEYLFESND